MYTKVKKRIGGDGERFSIMIGSETRLPLYYPNLFVTTQIRGRGCAANTCDKYLRILSILVEFECQNNYTFVERLKNFNYLNIGEIDALLLFCKTNFNNIKTKVTHIERNKNIVSASTIKERTSVITEYMLWLASLITPNITESNYAKLQRSITLIKAKSPKKIWQK